MVAPAPLTLGTAGHIDHGKTALVAALTGTDTDRLPEERRRGISIALGYAELELPSGRRLSVVDAPGHERFVRTMVAGATGIDCFLAVVAADDGVMPQTREHAAVLRALAVDRGVVAITKADRADPARAAREAAACFPGAAVVAVSAHTGAGLDDLRAALDALAAGTVSRATSAAPMRLHVDRVFSVRGAGTVVTGTLWSGTAGRGDELALLPGDGRRARVRGVQVHDAALERAAAGQRVALNLAGVDRDEVGRGDVLVPAGAALPVATHRVDVRLDCTPSDRVTVHHGTRETVARAVALGGGEWQLRLQAPIVAAVGDRVVVRAIAPPDTLGGGVVLDPAPPRRAAGAGRVAAAAPEPEPEPSVPAEAAAGADAAADAVLAVLRAGGLEPPRDEDVADDAALARLRDRGDALRLGPAMHLAADVYAGARDRVVRLLEAEGTVTLARVRDDLGSSRRVVQALLERLDADRVTLRRGDERVLRRRRPGR